MCCVLLVVCCVLCVWLVLGAWCLVFAGIIFGSKVVSLYGIQSTAIYVIFYVNELISSYRYDDIGYNLR